MWYSQSTHHVTPSPRGRSKAASDELQSARRWSEEDCSTTLFIKLSWLMSTIVDGAASQISACGVTMNALSGEALALVRTRQPSPTATWKNINLPQYTNSNFNDISSGFLGAVPWLIISQHSTEFLFFIACMLTIFCLYFLRRASAVLSFHTLWANLHMLMTSFYWHLPQTSCYMWRLCPRI